ncbi:PGPGW domain-containing protein [Candidatus Sumerlaeota bacterium]|nr:PGPGW domain-containing protein [Candidatus Sumerlaeota bacterium]
MTQYTRKKLRKIAVFIGGFTLIILSVVVGVLPGPGFIILFPLGLSVLATEFPWAKNLLKKCREKFAIVTGVFIPKKEKPPARANVRAQIDKS